MKPFFKSAAAFTFRILAEILDESESKLFSIKCLKCEHISELENRFFKGSGDIAVDTNEDALVNAEKNFVSIECKKCGNKIFSSEY
ncbi:hypothetical protein [Metabacillus bambusae]|uniref:Uncharacterized protein n=1 Tax=Metabacillus bambusae TaxID=2795218 RepID=A0ABS3MYW0_9BACI|nr:hypothetical protein [Metabacillus bambusae]MBO1511138.1 hypothetical protein [Metabacillus bambusae]